MYVIGGLGSSPAQHTDRAATLLAQLEREAQVLADSWKRRNCRNTYVSLVRWYSMYGRWSAETIGVGDSAANPPPSRAVVMDIERRFVAECLGRKKSSGWKFWKR